MSRGWGWAGSVEDFLSLPRATWLTALDDHHRDLWTFGASGSQRDAWDAEHAAMVEALRACCVALPHEASRWSIAFEYELPLEGGRRPDVVVLAGRTLVVVEFKSTALPHQADIDQVWGYARDLTEYHRASHGLPAYPIVVLSGAAPGFAGRYDGAVVTSPEGLAPYLLDARSTGTVDLDEWLAAPYEPLPTLVEAARRIFRDEPLPHVRRALAAGVPETVELLGRLVDDVAGSGGRLLAFVTGVPGAGKTLVGLRLVYERTAQAGRATFLSGNGPLVAVLQDALGSRAFVRDLHAYIRTYAMSQRKGPPTEHVIVFDEAQRAWDRPYMENKRGVAASEPQLLLDVGERIPEWAALVGLVGHGQEIHSGEEAGMDQWREAAVRDRPARWSVHCSPDLAATFTGLDVTLHEELDLTVSLRSRQAEQLHRWVQLLLEGSLALAARQAARLEHPLFPMYVTRDLDEAKEHIRRRYQHEPGKRYGLLASSHAKLLPRYGVDNSYMATSRMNIARWFNAPRDDPRSCCALDQPVTEFGCQGLELDLPLVCWGEDHRWTGDRWARTPIRRRYPQEDPARLLENTYRVLMTRGRDGVVVFVADERSLDQTEHALLAAGVRPLPTAGDLALGLTAG